jgi:hypothetical protein
MRVLRTIVVKLGKERLLRAINACPDCRFVEGVGRACVKHSRRHDVLTAFEGEPRG